jgi:hypothetical protein
MGTLHEIEIKLKAGKLLDAAHQGNAIDERISPAKGKIAALSVKMSQIVTKATRLETELKTAAHSGDATLPLRTISDIRDDIPQMEVDITLLKRALDDLK